MMEHELNEQSHEYLVANLAEFVGFISTCLSDMCVLVFLYKLVFKNYEHRSFLNF